MISVSSKILALAEEAVVLVRYGRIVLANPAAERFIGADCTGKKIKDVFSREIAEAQAGCFCADTVIAGRRCCVRTVRADDMQVYYISQPDTAPSLVNDAFIYAMRSSLMNMRMSVDIGRAKSAKYSDGELEENYNRLTRDHFRMARLLDNASVVRAVAAGELAVVPQPLDLTALCRTIIDTVSLLRADVGFSLYCDERVCVSADKELIEQLIFNLISNALTHAEGLDHITLSLCSTETAAMLSVSDNGCGISEDALSTVFERYRAGFEISSLGRGAGLGLSAVRAIAQAHDGTLMIESRAGRGTHARVSLARTLPLSTLKSTDVEYTDGMRSVLTGLADCLGEECFGERYMD